MTNATAFDDEAFLHAYPDGIDRDFWFLARHRITARLLRRFVAPGSRILDIGCGRGFTVKALRALGWDAHGVDLGRPAPLPETEPFVSLGQDAFQLPGREKYSALLLLDVLEHLEDGPEFLRLCKKSFAPGTALVMSLPAFQSLWSNYDVRYRHFRRYDIAMLQREAEAAGYSVAWCGYAYHGLYLPLRLTLASGKERNVMLKAPSLPFLHKILGLAFDLEQRMLPKKLGGTSLFAVLKPRP